MKTKLILAAAVVAIGSAGTAAAQTGVIAPTVFGQPVSQQVITGTNFQPVPTAGYRYIQQPTIRRQQVAYRYIQQPPQQVGYRYIQQPVQRVQYRYVQQPAQQVTYTTRTSGYQGWNYAGGSNQIVGYDQCAEQCAKACTKNQSYYQHCYRSCSDLSKHYQAGNGATQWQQAIAPRFGQIYTQAYLQPQVRAGFAAYQHQTALPANWWFQQPQATQWFSVPQNAVQAAQVTLPTPTTTIAPAAFAAPAVVEPAVVASAAPAAEITPEPAAAPTASPLSNFWSFRNTTSQ